MHSLEGCTTNLSEFLHILLIIILIYRSSTQVNMTEDYYTSPDRENLVLLTIDVQLDTTLRDAPLEIPGTLDALPFILHLVKAFRGHNLPIIHVVRLYRSDGSNVDMCRKFAIEKGKHVLVPGSLGSELMNELKTDTKIRLDSDLLLSGRLQQIGSAEWIMYKSRWGAFYQTPLEEHLHKLGINTVIICGCNFPNCPRTTIYEASERDFKVVLINDATSSIYDVGIRELENIGTRVMNTSECLSWLQFEILS